MAKDERIKELERQIKDEDRQEKASLKLDVKEEKAVKDYDPRKRSSAVKKVLNRIDPGRTFLINMELRSGDHRTFTIWTSKPTFRFQGGQYIIDEALKYYNINAKTHMLDYHQDFTLPIRRKINVPMVRKTLEISGMAQIESATNPSTIEHFMKAKVAEDVMRGAAIDELMKMVKIMLIVILIVTIIHFLLFVNASGMLKEMKVPFL